MSTPLFAYGLKFWLWPYQRQFSFDLKNPKERQNRLLTQIVNKLSNTKYGLLFNVSRRDTYEEFSKKVPVVTYDKLKHWIDRQKNHESNILVDEPVTRYAFLANNQLLPYTKSLESSFYHLFALQMSCAQLRDVDVTAAITHYKSQWGSSPTAFPSSLLAPGQPYHLEAPLLVKLPKAEGLLPLLSEVFFEFMDSDKKIWRLHELEPGKIYDVIISQKSGLYRYQMGMRLQALDPFRKTPTFQVIHDSHSDLRQTLP